MSIEYHSPYIPQNMLIRVSEKYKLVHFDRTLKWYLFCWVNHLKLYNNKSLDNLLAKYAAKLRIATAPYYTFSKSNFYIRESPILGDYLFIGVENTISPYLVSKLKSIMVPVIFQKKLVTLKDFELAKIEELIQTKNNPASYTVNDRVLLLYGPFANKEGVVYELDDKFIKIKIKLLNKNIYFHLDKNSAHFIRKVTCSETY
jgi:transcription antitermination factor NusG